MAQAALDAEELQRAKNREYAARHYHRHHAKKPKTIEFCLTKGHDDNNPTVSRHVKKIKATAGIVGFVVDPGHVMMNRKDGQFVGCVYCNEQIEVRSAVRCAACHETRHARARCLEIRTSDESAHKLFGMNGTNVFVCNKCSSFAKRRRDCFIFKCSAQKWVDETMEESALKIAKLEREIKDLKKSDGIKKAMNAIQTMTDYGLAEQARNEERDMKANYRMDEIIYEIRKCKVDLNDIRINMRRNSSSSSSESSDDENGGRMRQEQQATAGDSQQQAVYTDQQRYAEYFASIPISLDGGVEEAQYDSATSKNFESVRNEHQIGNEMNAFDQQDAPPSSEMNQSYAEDCARVIINL